MQKIIMEVLQNSEDISFFLDAPIFIFNEEINCTVIKERIWNLHRLGILQQLFRECAAKEFILVWALSQTAAYE